MRLSVIVSTYNSPQWLEKVLWGYQHQQFRDFELLIADDGSTHETGALIRSFRSKTWFPIIHIWHECTGFHKCGILNKAIGAATNDYIIFSDGDCIPREDFLGIHHDNKERHRFLSGGAVRLPRDLSSYITREHIEDQKSFDKQWLVAHGLKKSFFKNLKLGNSKAQSHLLNILSPTNATWNGGNSSAWKKDILSVNGFDERMGYGAEDREFGDRLMNSGVYGIQVRYSAVCVHLDHARSYKNKNDLDRNHEILQNTRKTASKWTSHGIIKEGMDDPSCC